MIATVRALVLIACITALSGWLAQRIELEIGRAHV